MVKYLYNCRNLYEIINETTHTYELLKFKKIMFDSFHAPIEFDDNTLNNNIYYCKYDKYDVNTDVIHFDKTRNNYFITDEFNLKDNYLKIAFNNGTYTHAIIKTELILFQKHNDKILHAYNNILLVHDKYNNLPRRNNTRELRENREILFYRMVTLLRKLSKVVSALEHELNRTEIINILMNINIDALITIALKYNNPSIIFDDSDIDTSDDDDDDDEETLTKKQIKEIMELKQELATDGKRPRADYTNQELNTAIRITSICNKNKESYLFGLQLLFNKKRANKLLKAILNSY